MTDHADTIRRADEQWRTQPTDLGGWANRATQMKQIAEALLAELQQAQEQATAYHDRMMEQETRAILAESQRQQAIDALRGLMEIAEMAMPDSYFQTDSRVKAARSVFGEERQ